MDTSVFIVSCDAYKDVWPPFFSFFDRLWPDCPYPVYLQSNSEAYSHPRVTVINTQHDIDWSQNLIQSLSRISSKRIILLMEDFLLWHPTKTDRIAQLNNCMDEMGAVYLRLVSKPFPNTPIENYPGVGIIDKGALYRCSAQASIWDRKTLLALLKPGESAWEFEMNGSKRSNALPGVFLSVDLADQSQWPIRYVNSIIKRKWTPEALDYCAEHGVSVNLKARPVCNWYDQLRRRAFVSSFLGVLSRCGKKCLGTSLYNRIKKHPLIRKIVY